MLFPQLSYVLSTCLQFTSSSWKVSWGLNIEINTYSYFLSINLTPYAVTTTAKMDFFQLSLTVLNIFTTLAILESQKPCFCTCKNKYFNVNNVTLFFIFNFRNKKRTYDGDLRLVEFRVKSVHLDVPDGLLASGSQMRIWSKFYIWYDLQHFNRKLKSVNDSVVCRSQYLTWSNVCTLFLTDDGLESKW